jgi:hypothetical protein
MRGVSVVMYAAVIRALMTNDKENRLAAELQTTRSQVRLYAILAQKAPLAVVFRRGPSKSVLLMKWNTSNDKIEFGQWFKGRIYERRCDLSPEGDLLLYFAANYRRPFYSWSAISRPPFLTALALWPKGDGWGGGGHFMPRNQIALNHRTDEMVLAGNSALPRRMIVEPFGNRPGWGEDDPIWSKRLKRDGWTLVSYPTSTKDDRRKKVWIEFTPPIKWRKPNPIRPKQYSLEMSILGLKERDGPWYLTEHSVIRNKGDVDKIGRTDWADWSPSGDLLFAMDGCLYRMPCKGGILTHLEDAVKVADFTRLRFENCEAPQEARRWPNT